MMGLNMPLPLPKKTAAAPPDFGPVVPIRVMPFHGMRKKTLRSPGVRVIIAEPSTSASLVAQVAARTDARAVTLIPSVGGDPEARDYLALFDVNIARLTAALAPGAVSVIASVA